MTISKLKPRHASEGRNVTAVPAERAFDAQGMKKLPTIKVLSIACNRNGTLVCLFPA